MTDEEKKAIETLRSDLAFSKSLRKRFRDEQQEKDYETILNLLEKQDNRIKKLESDNYECNNIIREYIEDWRLKTKMIDLMAEHLTTPIHSKKEVIEYFENKAKESGEIDEC